MKIHKVTYPPAALSALPPERLSAFLLVGHFLTEANWLQKLLWMATQDESGHKAERDARLCLAMMVTKLFAAKIHEGWNRLRTGPLQRVLDGLTFSPDAQSNQAELEKRLAKDSLLHKVRRDIAFHYPTSLSLDDLPGIHPDDVGLYLTPHAGDTISVVSELSAAAALKEITGASSVQGAIDKVLDDLRTIAPVYSDFLHAVLIALIDVSNLGEPSMRIIDDPDPPRFEGLHVRFFSVLPGTPAEA